MAVRHIAELRHRREELIESFPTTMVMEEMRSPRETFVLERGQYDKPLATRSPRECPRVCRRSTRLRPPNRLALARWLVDPANPLVARVAVNRFWQAYFGTGLVKTLDDFGSQGDAAQSSRNCSTGWPPSSWPAAGT